jgi:hypothetical protein
MSKQEMTMDKILVLTNVFLIWDGVKEFYLLDGVRDDGRNTFRTI